MTEQDFEHWSAQPKSVFCYYSGEKGVSWLDQRKTHDFAVNLVPEENRNLADKVWQAYLAGKVMPVQKRNDDGKLDWLCIKRDKLDPVKKDIILGAGRN